jgi:hypothetical protein
MSNITVCTILKPKGPLIRIGHGKSEKQIRGTVSGSSPEAPNVIGSATTSIQKCASTPRI